MKLAWTAAFIFSMLMQINQPRESAACGQLQNVLRSRITYGDVTHRWPWHAAIYHQSNGADSHYKCGGTLVTSKFILTAAHCVAAIAAEDIFVSLGRLHLNEGHDIAPFIKVAERLTHPEYSPENYANDIAIITLATDAIFNSYVQPICMWKRDERDFSEVIGKFGTVVGWGLTENGETSNVLQEVSLPIVSLITCLKSNRDLFGRFLTESNFCAGTRNGSSVCNGDSGGSMTLEEDGRFYLRGIVSVGADKLVDRDTHKFMCDSMQYAIFTDVAKYQPWIREITNYTILTECETVVRCILRQPLLDSTNICEAIILVEESGLKCKIIFDKTQLLNITTLQIYGNGTRGIPDLSNAVERFVNLDTLWMHSFNTVNRPRLSPFRNIIWFYISDSSNVHFDTDTFVDFGSLLNFTIENCEDITLPVEVFANNNQIQTFHFHHNRFYNLDLDIIGKIPNVKILHLNDNEIASLPANTFRNNKNLIELDLGHNYLTEVHEDLFNGLINLRILRLGSNKIEFVPPGLFRSNSRLTIVVLSYNQINKIEVDLTTLPWLSIFFVYWNRCMSENFYFPPRSLSEANEIIRRNCTN